MSEANDLVFDVSTGSSEVLRVDQGGDISFPAGSLRTVQCADLAAHIECRKELLALRDEGRALNNYGGVFVDRFWGDGDSPLHFHVVREA